MSLNIGQVTLSSSVALAPMAGVTDAPFRLLCNEFGCGAAVTEMVNARGMRHLPKHKRRALQIFEISPCERRTAIQLFGSRPEDFASAIDILSEESCAWFDINMGCPAPKIIGQGEGCALMLNPNLAERIIRAAVKKARLPITVKFRSGWDANSINAVEFAKMCEGAGAAMITLHARTRDQFYSGHADLTVIRDVKNATTIPIFGNGDVANAAGAMRMFRETGCDGIMIGRAAQGNPWIFEEINAALSDISYKQPNIARRAHVALRHADMMCAYKGADVAVREMRKHISWYLRGAPGAAVARERINHARDMREMSDLLSAFAFNAFLVAQG